MALVGPLGFLLPDPHEPVVAEELLEVPDLVPGPVVLLPQQQVLFLQPEGERRPGKGQGRAISSATRVGRGGTLRAGAAGGSWNSNPCLSDHPLPPPPPLFPIRRSKGQPRNEQLIKCGFLTLIAAMMSEALAGSPRPGAGCCDSRSAICSSRSLSCCSRSSTCT